MSAALPYGLGARLACSPWNQACAGRDRISSSSASTAAALVPPATATAAGASAATGAYRSGRH